MNGQRQRPRLLVRIAAYTALVLLTAIVLYPVMLVCKKAFEPGRHFALSASPVPNTLTFGNFEHLFGARGGHGELLFLRHTLNSLIIALATTVVGVLVSCTAAYATIIFLILLLWTVFGTRIVRSKEAES